MLVCVNCSYYGVTYRLCYNYNRIRFPLSDANRIKIKIKIFSVAVLSQNASCSTKNIFDFTTLLSYFVHYFIFDFTTLQYSFIFQYFGFKIFYRSFKQMVEICALYPVNYFALKFENRPYIYDVCTEGIWWMCGWGWIADLRILLFLNNRSIVHFCG